MKLFKEIWSAISTIGITPEIDERMERKIRLTNQIVLLACTMTFIQLFLFPAVPMYAFLCLGSFIAYAMTFYFNSNQWYHLSRVYFCVVSCLAIVIGGSLVTEDTNISFRIMLIQAFVIPMVVFDTNEFKYQMVGFGSFILFYLLFDNINEAIPVMEGVDTKMFDSNDNIVINGVFCMIILLLGNRYLQKLNFKAETNLQASLNISQSQQIELVKKSEFIREGISYAQRIQKAVLPKSEDLRVYLPDHFVIFQPKDIIGGDFYWQGEYKEHILVATVDCTGQGAPGALISIIGCQVLDQIVVKQGVTDPGEVLEILNLEIIKTLHHDGTVLKDGMDISLISIDVNKRKVRFAGAKNSVVIVSNGEVKRIRGERVSIGETYRLADGFKTHELDIAKDDSIFLMTDGVIDQFGGKTNKKFLHKRLYEHILANSEYSMDIQADCLTRTVKVWQGETEQTDDILILGMRINFDHIDQVRTFTNKGYPTEDDVTALAS